MKLIRESVRLKTYTISKFNYVIEISLSPETIQIKNIFNGMRISFFITKTWNGKRFLVSDSAFEKMSVLHPCVKKNEYRMCEHLTSAFYHIFPSGSDDELLCVFAALLSLKEHPTLSNKFKTIWQNNNIRYKYKILKYKKRQTILYQYTSEHVMIPVYEHKIKMLNDFIQLSKQSV